MCVRFWEYHSAEPVRSWGNLDLLKGMYARYQRMRSH
jgi:hypothetical protein